MKDADILKERIDSQDLQIKNLSAMIRFLIEKMGGEIRIPISELENAPELDTILWNDHEKMELVYKVVPHDERFPY